MANPPFEIALIAGLGNVGAKYEHTRHNMGVDLLMRLCDRYNISLNPESRFFGLVGRGQIEKHDVRLVFPTTYMNESGRAVGALCNFYRIAPEQVLVLHDEMDLPPGALKLRFGGGLAGHNGLKSICASLGSSQNFWRLRIGIGKAPADVISFVLNRPDPYDRSLLDEALDGALDGITTAFKSGADRGIAAVNGFKPASFKKE